MHFTLWPSRTSRTGGYAEITWEAFVAFVAAPQVAPSKNDLEGWSPVRFANHERSKANVEAVSCIVLDDDASLRTTDELAALWASCAGVVHTSYSHAEATPKHRIVLRASRDMTEPEQAAVWAYVTKHAGSIDEATKDASRLWYVPAHAEGAPYDWCELSGAPLDVDVILQSLPVLAAEPAATVANRSSAGPNRGFDSPDGGQSRRHALAQALGAAWPAKGRHEAQLALAGALRGEGWTEAEAVDFLCDVCRAAGDEDRQKREATVRHTWGKIEGSALTGWTRLKALVDPVIVDAARGALGRDAGWTEATMRRLADATSATQSIIAPPVEGSLTLGAVTFKVGGFERDPPPIKYQIDGLIAHGEIVMLVAHGNSLKTWLAFSLADAVASGRPWLGKFMVNRGRSAIVDFESGDDEVFRRLKLLGVTNESVGDRLLRASYPGAPFADPETWIGLGGHGLEMLVIDSFSAATPELDENDKRAAAMLTHAGRFANVTRCTVLVIHHSRKGSGGDSREVVRGSTALYAACDRVFRFDDVEKRDGGLVLTTMSSIKDGAGRAPLPVRVELSDQGLRYVEHTPAEQPPDDDESPARNRQRILEVLSKHSAGVLKADLLNVLKGNDATRREAISQLAIADVVVEYREHAAGRGQPRVFVMLNPNTVTRDP